MIKHIQIYYSFERAKDKFGVRRRISGDSIFPMFREGKINHATNIDEEVLVVWSDLVCLDQVCLESSSFGI